LWKSYGQGGHLPQHDELAAVGSGVVVVVAVGGAVLDVDVDAGAEVDVVVAGAAAGDEIHGLAAVEDLVGTDTAAGELEGDELGLGLPFHPFEAGASHNLVAASSWEDSYFPWGHWARLTSCGVCPLLQLQPPLLQLQQRQLYGHVL